MGLKIVEAFDGSFSLEAQAKATLFELLNSEAFLEQLGQELKGDTLEFTGLLFQPVPYSTATPKGMPAELEKFHESVEHVIIHVPPNFMFKSNIMKPSRLCAIYKKSHP